ncbi:MULTISPECIES: hypothetical protein [Shewanella]|uniref:hypothetical protein n=1 Tax=Shewanella TaxID=22 RepID=UPI00111D4962|nr:MULTISPECIES: hypothetical protein [Shewanella]MCB2383170.1 hypothetical protein [Shewanella sp. SR1]MCS6257852.1 hypothetical protein [Shewanella baltica]
MPSIVIESEQIPMLLKKMLLAAFILVSGFVGLLIGLFYSSSTIDIWFNRAQVITSVLASIATVLGVVLAYRALDAWKSQLRGSHIYNLSSELQDALLTTLTIAFNKDTPIIGNQKFGETGFRITRLSLELKLKKFEPEILTKISDVQSMIEKDVRDSNVISDNTMSTLLTIINELERNLNHQFK